MNESEKRRKQLLEETRSLYSDWRTPPAVHPRYRAAYGKLYKREEDQEEMPGTFGLRALLCFLLFAAFVAMDQQGGKILEAVPAGQNINVFIVNPVYQSVRFIDPAAPEP